MRTLSLLLSILFFTNCQVDVIPEPNIRYNVQIVNVNQSSSCDKYLVKKVAINYDSYVNWYIFTTLDCTGTVRYLKSYNIPYGYDIRTIINNEISLYQL